MSLPVQIQVLVGGQVRGHVVLDGARKVNKIGRTPTSQIRVDDPAASRVHAVIEITPAGASLIDMGSANGTQLNGARVNKAQLKHGDQITIGATMLLVSIGTELAMPGGVVVSSPTAASPTASTLPMMPVTEPAAQPLFPDSSQPFRPGMNVPSSAPVSAPAAPATAAAAASAVPQAFAPPAPVINTFRDTGSFSEDDPAIRRLQDGARRNRLIGLVVVLVIVGITALLLWLKPGIEVEEVPEAARYSNFGAREKPAVPVTEPPPAAVEPTRVGDAAAPPVAPAMAKAAFAASDARDEQRYLYRKLEVEQTLAQVVTEVYGSNVALPLAKAANPLLEDDRPLPQGTELRLPRFDEYEVQPGDTLGGIAAAKLGDPKRYPEILAANQDSLPSPDDLKVGSRLRLPLLR